LITIPRSLSPQSSSTTPNPSRKFGPLDPRSTRLSVQHSHSMLTTMSPWLFASSWNLPSPLVHIYPTTLLSLAPLDNALDPDGASCSPLNKV
jgi:hypothetical protein